MVRISENKQCLKTLGECKRCPRIEVVANSVLGGKNYYCGVKE